MRNNKNKKLKIGALILVLVITIGYAALRTSLNINGIARVSSSSFDVHFENYQKLNTTNITPTIEPTITGTTTTTINYEVTLTKPGDVYEFTVDAVNAGTIDAMIESISSKLNNTEITSSNLPAYLEYSATYSDGKPLAVKQQLLHNTRETIKLRVKYKEDIEISDLPSTVQDLSFAFTITYVQADSSAVPIPHDTFVYTISTNDRIYLNQAFPAGIQKFNSGSETGKNIYLKHKLDGNDIVKEPYVEFVINDTLKTQLKTSQCSGDSVCEAKYDALVNGTYTLRGGVNEESLSEKPIFDANQEVMRTAFGTLANDSNVCNNFGSSDPYCFLSSLSVSALSSGIVSVGDGAWSCTFDDVGYSYCKAW